MRKLLLLKVILIAAVSGYACTGFNTTADRNVYTAANMDWNTPYSNIRFIPGNNKEFGTAFISFGKYNYTMGMNEAGLAMDQFYIPNVENTKSKGKKIYEGDLYMDVLKKCATVDEALEMFDDYNISIFNSVQILISDKSGVSAILEGDYIHRKDDKYQVVTNFKLSGVKNDLIPCNRYKKATNRLQNETPDIKVFEEILNSTKQENSASHPTIFSYIFNLSNGDINLYSAGDFSRSVTYNIHEELKKGDHTIFYKELLPNERQEEYLAIYKKTRPKQKVIDETELKKYVGTYKFKGGYKSKIYLENGSLYYSVDNGTYIYEILPSRKNKFFAKREDYNFSFKENKKGKIVGLTFNGKLIGYHEAKKVLF